MTKIIAELCQNHNADKGLIVDMVAAAAEAGADIVKLQTIHSSQLSKRPRFDSGLIEGQITKTIKRPFASELSRLSKLDIDDSCVDAFLGACESNHVVPMTSIFTRDVVRKTFSQGFKNIKLASFDCISYPLVNDIISCSPNLLIVSTGCTYESEIKRMAYILASTSETIETSMLHCISIYPTPLSEANLSRIDFLKDLSPSVGLSDHSSYQASGLDLLKCAVTIGIDYVERHFTILPKDQTKDGVVSLSPLELAEARVICDWSAQQKSDFLSCHNDLKELTYGCATRELSHSELLNRDYYQGRFASVSVNGDIVFNWDNSFTADDIQHAQ